MRHSTVGNRSLPAAPPAPTFSWPQVGTILSVNVVEGDAIGEDVLIVTLE